MDGSDGLFEPLVDGETNPRLAWEVQNKPIFFIFTLKKKSWELKGKKRSMCDNSYIPLLVVLRA